jgi:hypothetical protein
MWYVIVAFVMFLFGFATCAVLNAASEADKRDEELWKAEKEAQ